MISSPDYHLILKSDNMDDPSASMVTVNSAMLKHQLNHRYTGHLKVSSRGQTVKVEQKRNRPLIPG